MFFLLKALIRIYHISQLGLLKLLKFPKPLLLAGEGSIKKLADRISADHFQKVLIVTDQNLRKLGLLDSLFEELKNKSIAWVIFDDVEANPSIGTVEKAKEMYLKEECEAVIAFGGGSPMDCAKVAAARVSNPNTKVRAMKGLFRVWKKLPVLYALPTTAGTGSETTAAAVISDPSTHEKFAIISLKIVPKVAVLDPSLTKNLPPHITSTTGMDALTHAVEAFIGVNKMKETDEMALKATSLIFENIEEAFSNGANLDARNKMALASYYAGVAFTQANVGYVHAVAHNLGGYYGVPHGLANAIILPSMLEVYGDKAAKKLAKMAEAANIGEASDTPQVRAEKFIAEIKAKNARMNIPTHIDAIQEKDIPLLAKRICKEGNPLYPVPKLLDRTEITQFLHQLRG